MSWTEDHQKSERLAADAELAMRRGDNERAERLYLEAARSEASALSALDTSKTRTVAITAVSAVSLFFKARAFEEAEAFALQLLSTASLAAFGRDQLKGLLHSIWGEAAISAAGLKFAKRDVLVSVRGGQVLTGGAPLDLILRKVEEVRALLYRTIEMLMDREFRRRGGPAIDIQQTYRPWLFQAAPGSYQFAVRLESVTQLEFPIIGAAAPPTVELVTSKFLEIVNAAATEPDEELPRIVPDVQYREAFLKLTRNLAPNGKAYSALDIRSAADPSLPEISLVEQSRKVLTESIRRSRPPERLSEAPRPVALTGILRGVHLDEDWLEVTVADATEQRHVKVLKAGDVIDDVVGPMVNRPVNVETNLSEGKYYFVDIQAID